MTIDELWHSAHSMSGPEALPRPKGQPMFEEPWHGRLVALAVETVHRRDLPWDSFRDRLIEAIADDPERPYYDSFLVALEQLAMAEGLASEEAITSHRFEAASYRTTEIVRDDLEVFPIAVDEETLLAALTLLFDEWWSSIAFGPLIEGAAYELKATRRPTLTMLDGYLTIDFGHGHFHICIGAQAGAPGRPVRPELARRRRCAHAELQRLWVDGAPRSWMFRMFNGDGDQQLTVLLPNPFLDDEMQLYETPQWSRLECWDGLRRQFLSLAPDPDDRLGTEFVHG